LTVTGALKSEARIDRDHYDVFLSQTIKDQEIVFGVYAYLTEELGVTVFCDWIEAPDSDRAKVTPQNARYIRNKMRRSSSLLFLDTENADQSKWMCWELGWFDSANGKIGVLPVLRNSNDSYRGREFLGLYPVVEVDTVHKLKVSATPELLRAILTPGQVYGIATSLPLPAWTRLSYNPFI
jgi:hypothetical protein